jgi:nucleoside-diphosphate kinase
MAEQATLVIIKPDGLKKSLTGNILTRLSETRLKIAGAKVVRVSRELAEKHYAHLAKKPFFEELVRYITGDLHGDNRVLALVYWGENAIEKIHDLAGATNPEQAVPTTIRGQYGRILTSGVFENVIHTSSEPEEAEREIKLWFEPHDIVLDLYPVREVVSPERKVQVWA